jgi:hypothetical protein
MKVKEFLETELNEKSKSNLEKDAASHIPARQLFILYNNNLLFRLSMIL